MFRICSSKCQNEMKELNAFCEKLLSEKAGWGFEKNTMMKKMEEKEKRNIELIKENMDYREQIVHLEKKVKEIEPLENKIIEKDSIIAMLEERLSIFEDEFCQYREVQERTIKGLNDKLNRFRKHKKNYKNKLKEKIKENKELIQELEECKTELIDLNYWFKEMENCADYYASENKELKEENEKLLKDMEKVRETVGYAEWDGNQIEQQHEQMKGLECKNHQLLERIKNMEEDKEKLTLRERHLEETNHTLLNDMSAKDDEIDELQNRIEQLEETLSIAIEEINAQVSFMEDSL